MKRFMLLGALFLLFLTGCGKIGSKVEDHIELVGSALTETPVSVFEVNLKAARGAAEIRDFSVANPRGYVARNAMSCERVYVNLGLVSTVTGDPLTIDRLIISYPVLNLEQNAQGGSNLKEISENIERNGKKADQESAEFDPASPDTPTEPLRIRIKELIIEGVTLNVLRVDGSSASAILPSIRLEDVGGERGVTPAELGLVVSGAMTGEMLKEMIARELIERGGHIKKALSAENLMAVLANTVNLSPEMKQTISPVVEELSKALMEVIDVWVDQGYIDLAELNEQLAPVFDTFKKGLAEHLDNEQVTLLTQRLSEIENNGLEVLRYLAIHKIVERLEISPDQLVQIRSILHEHFVSISEVIKQIAANPQRNREMLITAYYETSQRLQTSLSERLTEKQMEKVDLWLDEALDKILIIADRFFE
ncbi:MAG: hypothetical protein ACR2PB_14860 [Desulfocapsaceae bacterium]